MATPLPVSLLVNVGVILTPNPAQSQALNNLLVIGIPRRTVVVCSGTSTDYGLNRALGKERIERSASRRCSRRKCPDFAASD